MYALHSTHLKEVHQMFVVPLTHLKKVHQICTLRLTHLHKLHNIHQICEAIKPLAKSLNIKLIPIPAGATDLCQSLDVRIFGLLKMKARARMAKILAQHVLTSFNPKTCTFHFHMNLLHYYPWIT